MNFWESKDKCVKKEIIQKGDFSDRPTERAKCTILVDEPQAAGLTIEQLKNEYHSEFLDKSTNKVIIIGEACSAIDRYIERAIQLMSLNEKSIITVQIPDEKDNLIAVSVVVTLKSAEFHKPIWEWTPEEKYEVALQYKQKGVDLFRDNRIVDAFYKFSKACKILITLEPLDDEEFDEEMRDPYNMDQDAQMRKQDSTKKELIYKIRELKNVLYNNMAECQLIRQNYDHTVTLCNKVLNRDHNNVKALYRRGVAYGGMRDFEKAVNDLKTVITLEPKDKRAQEKYNIYNEQWQISVQGSKDIMRKMFKT